MTKLEEAKYLKHKLNYVRKQLVDTRHSEINLRFWKNEERKLNEQLQVLLRTLRH